MSTHRLFRRSGSNEGLRTHTVREIVQVNGKEVFIGNHAPTTHFAAASQQFIPAEALYENRRSRKGKGGQTGERKNFQRRQVLV